LEGREIRVVRRPPLPLYVREGDIVDKESEYILACCHYCHDNYVPVPMADYSYHVVYNCGCYRVPLIEDEKIACAAFLIIVTAIALLLFALAVWIRSS